MTDVNNDLLTRLVVAVEGLLTINQSFAEQAAPSGASEGGPPICPSCNTLNPQITLEEGLGSTGPFSEFGLTALCKSCDKIFYALPDGWTTTADKKEFVEQLEQRSKIINMIMKG